MKPSVEKMLQRQPNLSTQRPSNEDDRRKLEEKIWSTGWHVGFYSSQKDSLKILQEKTYADSGLADAFEAGVYDGSDAKTKFDSLDLA